MEAIVKVRTFNMIQEVFITDKKSATGFSAHPMELDKIPDFLMSLKDLSDIHIFGNESFLRPTIKKIRDKEYLKYNKNSITIHINK